MRTMEKIKRGDIYFVVGGAAIGSEQSANRPAVVVSNDIGNRFAPIVEVVYLTTRKRSACLRTFSSARHRNRPSPFASRS